MPEIVSVQSQGGSVPPPPAASVAGSGTAAAGTAQTTAPVLLVEGAAARLAPPFTSGELVNAQILAIRSQVALVTIKGALLTARLAMLDQTLEPGASIQARISSVTPDRVTLQVLRQIPPLDVSAGPVEGQVLRSLQLPVTPLYTGVLREMVAQQLPLTREFILTAVHGLQQFLEAEAASLTSEAQSGSAASAAPAAAQPDAVPADGGQAIPRNMPSVHPQEAIRAVVNLVRRNLPPTPGAVTALAHSSIVPMGETLRQVLEAVSRLLNETPAGASGNAAATASAVGSVAADQASGQTPSSLANLAGETPAIPMPSGEVVDPAKGLLQTAQRLLLDLNRDLPVGHKLGDDLRRVVHSLLQKDPVLAKLTERLEDAGALPTSPPHTGAPELRVLFHRLAEHAIAQQLQSQPQQLPVQSTVLYLQIPVLTGHKYHTAELDIHVNPDARHRHQEGGGDLPCRVACRLNTSRLGPVAVDLDLAGKALGLTFTFGSENVQRFCAEKKEELRANLESSGLSITRLEFTTKVEPSPAAAPETGPRLTRINLKF